MDWNEVLSAGEKQRLCAARILTVGYRDLQRHMQTTSSLVEQLDHRYPIELV